MDTALLCIGRRPNLESLNLDAAGVRLDVKNGSLDVRDGQSITQAHVWGAGDITADVSLANVAEMEGRHVVDRILSRDPALLEPLRYDNLSTIMFFDPLVSAVGLGELALQKACFLFSHFFVMFLKCF